LKAQAFNYQKKDYLSLAIKLLRAHLYELGASRHQYSMSNLVIDLGLGRDFGYSEDSLKTNANRFLKKFTGYDWNSLVIFAKSNKI